MASCIDPNSWHTTIIFWLADYVGAKTWGTSRPPLPLQVETQNPAFAIDYTHLALMQLLPSVCAFSIRNRRQQKAEKETPLLQEARVFLTRPPVGCQALKGSCEALCLEGLLVVSLCGNNKRRNSGGAKGGWVFIYFPARLWNWHLEMFHRRASGGRSPFCFRHDRQMWNESGQEYCTFTHGGAGGATRRCSGPLDNSSDIINSGSWYVPAPGSRRLLRFHLAGRFKWATKAKDIYGKLEYLFISSI